MKTLNSLIIFLIAFMLTPVASFAQEAKPEAPRGKILPYRQNYTCSGEWQRVITKRNQKSISRKHVGFRCVDKKGN